MDTLEKLLRAGALHEKRLKQLRIVRLASSPCRLSLTGDRQNLYFFHRLLSQSKANQVTVVRVHVRMSPQDVARGIEDDLTVINFNPFRVRRGMFEEYISAWTG